MKKRKRVVHKQTGETLFIGNHEECLLFMSAYKISEYMKK